MSFVRWLIALALLFAVDRADAGTFKARGTTNTKPAAKTPAKTEPAKKTEKAEPEKKPAAKTAQKAPAKKPAATAKKKPSSQVATKGRPDDLTPNPKKKGDVRITEDDEEDVIIRDLDD